MPEEAYTAYAMSTALTAKCMRTEEYQNYSEYREQFEIGAQAAVDFAMQRTGLFEPIYGDYHDRMRLRKQQEKQAKRELAHYVRSSIPTPEGSGFGHGMWVTFIWPMILSAIVSALVRMALEWLFTNAGYQTLVAVAKHHGTYVPNGEEDWEA